MDQLCIPVFHYAYRPLNPLVDGMAGFSVTAYAGGALAFCTYAADQSRQCTWFYLSTAFRVQLSQLLDRADAWLGSAMRYHPFESPTCRSQLCFWDCSPIVIDEMGVQINAARVDPVGGADILPVAELFWDTASLLNQQGFYLSPDGFQWDAGCRIITPSGTTLAPTFLEQKSS